MKLRINSIMLIGAERNFRFDSGLNIISGPIASGKTTLIRCMRALLAGDLNNFSMEARETIHDISGQLRILDSDYSIVRPFVTTRDAKIDIAGELEVERLPVSRVTKTDNYSYSDWLIAKLGLPHISVPSAPTKIESDLSPVTINDYLLYCYLKQDEIDNSVFGHTDPFKDIKRKYVFDIIYGRYNIESATLRERLRNVVNELQKYRNLYKTLNEVFEDTSFGNKSTIQREIDETLKQIERIEKNRKSITFDTIESTGTNKLNNAIKKLDHDIEKNKSQLYFERNAIDQKLMLIDQLITQKNRLTKAIVAEDYFIDFDFMICPRCGSEVHTNRVSGENCYLCLQPRTQNEITREDLIKEQDRLNNQIIETRELVKTHQDKIIMIDKILEKLNVERNQLSKEIDYLTNTFISDRAEIISANTKIRTELKERLKWLDDKLTIFEKQNKYSVKIRQLENEEQELSYQIDAADNNTTNFEERINYLDEKFIEVLESFKVPHFRLTGYTGINRKTYKPVIQGRLFDSIQSAGLTVLVNIAHAIAHQITAIDFGLKLPNILFIDGITKNIGREGLDNERIIAVHKLLIHITNYYEDQLQIIIADNIVPDISRKYIRVVFTESDKLIPNNLLTSEQEFI